MITEEINFNDYKDGLVEWVTLLTGITNVYGADSKVTKDLPYILIKQPRKGNFIPHPVRFEGEVGDIVEVRYESSKTVALDFLVYSDDVVGNDAESIMMRFENSLHTYTSNEKLEEIGMSILNRSDAINFDMKKDNKWERRWHIEIKFNYVASVTEEVVPIEEIGTPGTTIIS